MPWLLITGTECELVLESVINPRDHLSVGQIATIVEPLEALDSQSLSIWCIFSQNGASGFTLRENEVVVEDRVNRGSRNETHTEFIFGPVMRSDNGRAFVCSLSEIFSAPSTLTVFCKQLLRSLHYNNNY